MLWKTFKKIFFSTQSYQTEKQKQFDDTQTLYWL